MRESERQGVLAVLACSGALTTLVLDRGGREPWQPGDVTRARARARARRAHGARRRRTRIVRQLVIESVPLVAMGALGSLGFAWAAATLIAALGGFPPYLDFSIRWGTVMVRSGAGLPVARGRGIAAGVEDRATALDRCGQRTAARTFLVRSHRTLMRA
jgi:hypothetical protein